MYVCMYFQLLTCRQKFQKRPNGVPETDKLVSDCKVTEDQKEIDVLLLIGYQLNTNSHQHKPMFPRMLTHC